MSFTKKRFLMLAGFLLTCASSIGAQGPAPAGRTAIRVILVDSLPVRGARAVISRQGQFSPKDAILLTPETATARQLSAAVFTFLTFQAVGGSDDDRDAL